MYKQFSQRGVLFCCIAECLSLNFFLSSPQLTKHGHPVPNYILTQKYINFHVSIFVLRTFSCIRAESDIGQHILQPRKYKRSNCQVAGKKNKEGKKKSWKSRRREKTVQALHHRTVSQRHVSTIEEKWNPHLPLSRSPSPCLFHPGAPPPVIGSSWRTSAVQFTSCCISVEYCSV